MPYFITANDDGGLSLSGEIGSQSDFGAVVVLQEPAEGFAAATLGRGEWQDPRLAGVVADARDLLTLLR